MSTFALDTNIITYILKGDTAVVSRFNYESIQGNVFIFPPIAYYEIRRWFLESGAVEREKKFEELCQSISLA